METKRCLYCQKLSPAYATVCSRCGYSFPPPATWRRGKVRRSIPPASPQRAGYHAGLHPEDQPDLSSLLPVPSSPVWAEPPPGEVRETPPTPPARQEPQRILLQAQGPLLPPQESAAGGPPGSQAVQNGSPAGRGSFLPALLSLLCLLALMLAGLLSYLAMVRRPSIASPAPALTVIPRELRINDSFTLTGSGFGAGDELDVKRDGTIALTDGRGQQLHVHVSAAGTFSLQISITADWQPGEHQLLVIDQERLVSVSTTLTVLPASPAVPHLQLSDYDVYLGADRPGATTRLAITLVNSGGGELNWQAASDRAWLNVTPLSGSFSGSESVTLTVNRAQLQPGDYTGHVIFQQQNGSEHGATPAALQQMLTVRMTVLPAPASLSIAPTTLTYTASTTQNPPAQSLVLQNGGGEPVSWSSSVTTGDGGSWLSVAPSTGQLAPGASATVSVAVISTGLAPGSYQGSVAFQGGTQQGNRLQVTIALTVVTPGSLVVTPPTLSFSSTAGLSPADQTLTLQNSGGLPLAWTLSASTQDGAPWLTATPTAGQLAARASLTVTVHIAAAGLAAGAYQGLLTISTSSAGGVMKTVAVALTVNPPPAPVITVSPDSLLFSVPHGSNPAPQTVTIGNSGNAALNWVVRADQSTPTISITPASGQGLAPGKSVAVTIAPVVAQLPANSSLSLTLTVAASGADSNVPSRQILLLISIT